MVLCNVWKAKATDTDVHWMCTGCGASLCATTYCNELYHTDPKLYDKQLKECLSTYNPDVLALNRDYRD